MLMKTEAEGIKEGVRWRTEWKKRRNGLSGDRNEEKEGARGDGLRWRIEDVKKVKVANKPLL